jgi:hypothetical protein
MWVICLDDVWDGPTGTGLEVGRTQELGRGSPVLKTSRNRKAGGIMHDIDLGSEMSTLLRAASA